MLEAHYNYKLSDAEKGSVSLHLSKINNRNFDENEVVSEFEKIHFLDDDFSALEIAIAFTDAYSKSHDIVTEGDVLEDAVTIIEEEDRELWYLYSSLCTLMLPTSKTSETKHTVQYPNKCLEIESSAGLPYGSVARMLIMYLSSKAVKSRNPTVELGRSLRSFILDLSYKPNYNEGEINDQVIEQLNRIFHSTYYIKQREESKSRNDGVEEITITENNVRFNILSKSANARDFVDGFQNDERIEVTLSDDYFNELIKHAVPLSLEVIKKLKKSPLALDLYVFLSYRSNTNRVIGAKLSSLKKQFGHKETWRFQQRLSAALKLVSKHWPGSNFRIQKNILIIPPTKPLV